MTKEIGKRLMVLAVVSLSCLSLALGHSFASDAKTGKAVLIIAYNDFNDSEYSLTKEILENNGIKTTAASSQKGIARCASLEVPVGLAIDQLKVSDYDAIIFIGGFGAPEEYMDNPRARMIVQEAAKQKKVLAAICAAQGIIYNADVIAYKLPAQTPPGKNVRIEGNIILGGGPSDARYFAQTIVTTIDRVYSRE